MAAPVLARELEGDSDLTAPATCAQLLRQQSLPDDIGALAGALLQRHAEDAAADIEALLSACEQVPTTTEVLPLLVALADASAAFDAALPSEDENADSAGCTRRSGDRKTLATCSHVECAPASMSEQHASSNNSKAAWAQFLRLSTALDDHRFDSKTGRKLSVVVALVAKQQQWILTLVRGSNDATQDPDTDTHEKRRLQSLAKKMEQLATRALVTAHGADDSAGSDCIGASSEPALVFAGGAAADVIMSDAALESYLLAKKASSAAAVQPGDQFEKDRELLGGDEKPLVHAQDTHPAYFKILLRVVSTPVATSKDLVTSDMVQHALDELSLVASARVLGIQTSFLLAAQLRSKHTIAQQDTTMREHLLRQTLREFNSLTMDGADTDKSLRALLRLAGFVPTVILREIVDRAVATPLHVHTYVQVLELCPLLVEWSDDNSKSPVILRELKRALSDLLSQHDVFEAQGQHLLDLMCSLAQLLTGDASQQTSGDAEAQQRRVSGGIVNVHTLIQEVIMPAFPAASLIGSAREAPSANSTVQVADYFVFLRDFVHAAVGDSRWRTSRSGIQTLQELLAALMTNYGKASSQPILDDCRIDLANTLLLTIRDILIFLSTLPRSDVLRILEKSVQGIEGELDETILTLIDDSISLGAAEDILPLGATDNTFARWNEFAVLLRHQAGVQHAHDIIIDVDACQASRIIRLLLWRMLWKSFGCTDQGASRRHEGSTVRCGEREWAVLAAHARIQAVPEGDVGNPVKTCGVSYSGSALIVKELAHVMLFCRASLSTCLIEQVLPTLTELVRPSRVQQLRTPEQLVSRDASGTTPTAGLCCELPASHAVVQLVSRSWSSLVFDMKEGSSDQDHKPVLNTVHHFLVASDWAISDAKTSLSGLLSCLQWICYIAWVLSCSRMAYLESYEVIQSQLSVRLLRVLHLLSEVHVTKEDDATRSQHFAASWVAILPPTSYEQACTFISSMRSE